MTPEELRAIFEQLQEYGDFDIEPCQKTDVLRQKGIKQLSLTTEQKNHMSAFINQLPSIAAAETMSGLYRLSFPKDLPHTLVKLNQGGYSTILRGDMGRFVGTASLYPVTLQATILSTFNVMSIASGQYFLSQINNEMKMMKSGIDKILEFLYGDKKAELLAEASFIKYVYENYSSIMEHNLQALSALDNLQETKKVAMKDVEFYISDMDATVNDTKDNLDNVLEKVFRIKECLEFSIRLYTMTNLLEVYYSRNYDSQYLDYIEDDASKYITKCEKYILSSLSAIKNKVQNHKADPFGKKDYSSELAYLDKEIEQLQSVEESVAKAALNAALTAMRKKTEYYIDSKGELYMLDA